MNFLRGKLSARKNASMQIRNLTVEENFPRGENPAIKFEENFPPDKSIGFNLAENFPRGKLSSHPNDTNRISKTFKCTGRNYFSM